jgi:hypothetical protein
MINLVLRAYIYINFFWRPDLKDYVVLQTSRKLRNIIHIVSKCSLIRS